MLLMIEEMLTMLTILSFFCSNYPHKTVFIISCICRSIPNQSVNKSVPCNLNCLITVEGNIQGKPESND